LSVILEILGGHCKHAQILFIDMFFPLEEYLREIDTMKIDEAELDSCHGVLVVSNSLTPFLPSSVDHILMSFEAVLE